MKIPKYIVTRTNEIQVLQFYEKYGFEWMSGLKPTQLPSLSIINFGDSINNAEGIYPVNRKIDSYVIIPELINNRRVISWMLTDEAKKSNLQIEIFN